MKILNYFEPLFRSVLVLSLVLILVSCSTQTDSTAAAPAATDAAQTVVPGAENPAPKAKLPKLNGMATVVLTVKGQPITIEVDGKDAPVTAGNFVDLVKRGVYTGTVFHRVEPGFVAQGGDPLSKEKSPSAPLGTGSFIDPKTNRAPIYSPRNFAGGR